MNSKLGSMAVWFGAGVIVTAIVAGMVHYWSVAGQCSRTTLLNPRFCSLRQTSAKQEYDQLRLDLEQYIAQQKQSGGLQDIGVYFRDLDNGPVLGINQDTGFVPASLMKVPLMMTYLRYADENPALLKTVMRTPKDLDTINQSVYPPKDPLQPDTDYTIEEMIRRLIEYSDNRANQVLQDYATAHFQDIRHPVLETLYDLGLVPVQDPTSENDFYLTTKQYSSMFRILYNAAYLSLTMSNKALGLLSETDFRDGLVALLPTSTRVAHKFGVYTGDGFMEMHDVGIVYHTKSNYLLAVMTKGKSFEGNAKIIQEISKMVWDEVDSRS